MEWTQVPDGLVSGPYRIERIGGAGWRLFYQDKLVEEAGSLSLAVADAGALEHGRRRRHRAKKLVLILAVTGACLLAVYPFRSEPNPDYTAARAVVDRLSAIQSDVAAGALTLDGVAAAHPGDLAADVNGTLVVSESLGTDCYYIAWSAATAPARWLLPGQTDCRPDVVLALKGNYIGGDQSLPPTRRTPGWFFPVLVGLLVVALNATLILFNLATRAAHQTDG